MAVVKNICLEALERHCTSGDTGRLDFHRNTYSGQIYVENGQIIHAQLSGLEGIPALFRLFDWGDAETTWQAGERTETPSLNLTMDDAGVLYAENLQDRAELEAKEKERIDQALAAPEMVAGQVGGIESVLKHYTISLECKDASLLPGGFTFADAAKSSYVIGSSEDCDVVLRNPTVDPLHCGVILERGSVLVWDLGAQSGIKLNGNQVAQDVLKVGDVMTLGSLDLCVRFQLRRPTIRVKPTTPADEKAKAAAAAAAGITLVDTQAPTITATGTILIPKVGAPPTRVPKEVPKGPITYNKVVKQLKQQGKGTPFLEKLASLFGAKKNK